MSKTAVVLTNLAAFGAADACLISYLRFGQPSGVIAGTVTALAILSILLWIWTE